jgi:signal transduction histidine kinase
MISLFWIGTLVMLTLVLGLLFLVIFYQRNLAAFKIKEAKELLKNSLESEKEERKRISLDLHDGLQGDLSAVRNFLVLLKRAKTDEDKELLLFETRTAVENAIENTRLLSQKLMPPLLIDGGLIVVLNQYFKSLNKSTGKTFLLRADLFDSTFSETASYELFRVIQEFCTNFIKYGNDDQFLVVIMTNDIFNVIEIIDNGIPFYFKECYTNSNGSGLKNIQTRITVLNGTLDQREVVNGNHFVIHLIK